MEPIPSPPLGLYLHFPWCVRKCPYCDFNSHRLRGELPEGEYVAALVADLERELPLVWGRRVVSLFLGGGTPSLFSPEAVAQLLAALHARLPWSGVPEVTLEANPGTVDSVRLAELRDAGITRLSLGVQSFCDEALSALGRIHDAADGLRAVAAAHRAGFESFNLDLMFGLPGQEPADARRDLETALSLAPPHLSYYQLTLEPNTRFARFPPPLPDEDSCDRMQMWAVERLAQQGLHRYEVSAYAGAGHRCRHNLNYWQFGDYLGIGAGAHGKLTGPWGVKRRWKVRHPQDYLAAGDTLAGERVLGGADLVLEFMLNALRLTEGFDLQTFRDHTGLDPGVLADPVGQAERQGLVVCGSGRVAPTPLGLRFLNDLLQLFMDSDGT